MVPLIGIPYLKLHYLSNDKMLHEFYLWYCLYLFILILDSKTARGWLKVQLKLFAVRMVRYVVGVVHTIIYTLSSSVKRPVSRRS